MACKYKVNMGRYFSSILLNSEFFEKMEVKVVLTVATTEMMDFPFFILAVSKLISIHDSCL